ncbi:MSHA pilin protein MshC [Alteromonadaceae bacterium Bs31]|nr:MSHA pilin protein MshC [Alteromonadaceae bacterium Bs31]
MRLKLLSKGFTLVELIAVLLIVGVLAVSTLSAFGPATSSMQLQSSRDSIVAAFQSAQQMALTRRNTVQILTSSSELDLRYDADGDGVFSAGESVQFGGVSYPIQLVSGQTLSTATFNYNRLGHTAASTLQLSQNGKVIPIVVDDSGYVK